MDDCIGRGKVLKEAEQSMTGSLDCKWALPTLGNGVAAIRDVVFDKGKIRQSDLACPLADNFSSTAGLLEVGAL